MGLQICLVTVFAAILAAPTVHGLQFPHGKTLVYKYYGNVKTGTMKPAPYASEFTLEGTLYLKHDTSDPIFINAYYVALLDVKTSMYNGAAGYHEGINNLNPIDEPASVLQQPFMMFYDGNGTFRAVQILEDEAGWSKNMKMAIASMLQIDVIKIDMQTPEKHQTFITKENTIHGDCSIVYNVEPKEQHSAKEFIVKKCYSPINCTGFEVHNFNLGDIDNCRPIKEKRLNGDIKRIVEIEKQGDEIIIKKLSAHGNFNYLPSYAISDAHYVLTNATFNLERIVPVSEINLPFVDFRNERIIHDITYKKPKGRYAQDAAMDSTNGRHFVNFDIIVPELKKMLEEAVDYTEKNHLDMETPDWTHGQTINRILETMSYMDLTSLELVFNSYESSKNRRYLAINNFFCNIVAQVGTAATSLFSLNAIRDQKIPFLTAIAMLDNLAVNVKEPNEKLLEQLEDLLKFNDSTPVGIKRAGILCFSSLLYRTFKHLPHPEKNTVLQGYLHEFFNRVKNDVNYEMKVVYLMAIRNVEVGKIHDLLTPIIKGDLTISKNPENIRLLAIWAVEKAILKHYLVAEKLLWPIMTDSSLPVKLRIAAYEILIHIPNDVLLRRINWFMVIETNIHLRNYHYTTLKNIAKSSDPCKADLRKLLGKIIRYNIEEKNTFFTLSAAYHYDVFSAAAEKFHSGVILNEVSRIPEVMQFEYSLAGPAEAVIDMGIRLNVQGLTDIFSKIEVADDSNMVENPNVLEILTKAARDLPPLADIYVDIVLMRKGCVVMANHYNRQTLRDIFIDMVPYIFGQPKDLGIHLQNIEYEQLSQKQMINDMGLPVILDTRVPVVTSFDFVASEIQRIMSLKYWRHGEHSLSTYNPIADAWHSVQRTSAMDISLRLPTTVNFSLLPIPKFKFPEPPPEKIRFAGFFQYVKDSVKVTTANDSEALKKSCDTCNLQEDVIGIDNFPKHNVNGNFISMLTGRQYSYSVLGCPLGHESNMSNLIHWINSKTMTAHQKFKSMLIYPQVGSCSIFLMAKRSIRYPASEIFIRVDKIDADKGDDDPTGYVLNRKKDGYLATINVNSTATKTSLSSWQLKYVIDFDDDYLLSHIRLQLIRKIPGEQDYKICVYVQKSYQPVPLDLLKIDGTEQEINSSLTIIAGYTDAEKCVSDDAMITITMKGELSEEQKTKLNQDLITGHCSKDIKNPLYPHSKKEVPMTLNCLNEAITYSSLRKYTINLAHKSVPQELFPSMMSFYDHYLRSAFRAYLQLNIERLDAENLKIIADFPMQTNDTEDDDHNKAVTSLPGDFQLSELQDVNEDIAKPLWHQPLDNTRFSNHFLSQYTGNKIKMCVIYPRIILTADHKSIPFNVPREWTLITGDHFTKKLAIFAKIVGEKLSTKIYAERQEVLIFPSSENIFRVMIDGEVVADRLTGSVLVPNEIDTRVLKLTRKNDLIIVHFNKVPSLSMVYSANHITLNFEIHRLKGKVCGLCGRLDGTNPTNITEVYTLA